MNSNVVAPDLTIVCGMDNPLHGYEDRYSLSKKYPNPWPELERVMKGLQTPFALCVLTRNQYKAMVPLGEHGWKVRANFKNFNSGHHGNINKFVWLSKQKEADKRFPNTITGINTWVTGCSLHWYGVKIPKLNCAEEKGATLIQFNPELTDAQRAFVKKWELKKLGESELFSYWLYLDSPVKGTLKEQNTYAAMALGEEPGDDDAFIEDDDL